MGSYTYRLRTDGIISGVSLYTPNLLVALVYITAHENQSNEDASGGTPKRGITRRQNALQPEMRIIHLETQEESTADTLNVSRFECLTAADYHLGILPVIRSSIKGNAPKGALELMSGIGGTIWDASMYPTKMIGNAAIDATRYSARLFASGTGSVRSVSTSGEKRPRSKGPGPGDGDSTPTSSPFKSTSGPAPHPALLTRSMKIFVQSPYDCVLATKPTLADHLAWLVEHEQYEEAYLILDAHPETAAALPMKGSGEDSSISTPTKAPDSLVDFFDDSSQSSPSGGRQLSSHSEREKRRIGQKWVQDLVKKGQWSRAGQVCGKVLRTPSNWEHWVWVFAEADHHDEICAYIPTEQLRPPMSSTIYEVMLGNYISRDRPKLAELLDKWPTDLYNVKSIISALESKLRFGDVREDTVENGVTGRDWRLLMNGLAKLYLSDGRARDALHCYIKSQDADMAMDLIKNQHLIDAVADDIPGLMLLRIPKEKLKYAPLSELEELSAEPVQTLASEAHQGVVTPGNIVKQIGKRSDMRPFLFFYFRALWSGSRVDEGEDTPRALGRTRRSHSADLQADEGRALVNDYADTVLDLFAEYDRDLLFSFLKVSPSYTLSTASTLCERRGYIPELVHLLAKEGRTKKALAVILDQLADIPHALAFARDQADPELWDDLVAQALHKPVLLRALLAEVGAAGVVAGAGTGPTAERGGAVADPIALVRRIPAGMEIEGLRDALARLLREYELQDSISEGVARVLRGEVAVGMASLHAGQKRGFRFETQPSSAKAQRSRSKDHAERRARRKVHFANVRLGCCCGCGQRFKDEPPDPELDPTAPPPVPLIAFPCSHAFHLTCLLAYMDPAFARPARLPAAISPSSSPTPSQRPSSSPPASAADASPSPAGRLTTQQVERFGANPEDEDFAEPSFPRFDDRVMEALAHPLTSGIGPKVAYAKGLRRAQPSLIGAGCPLEWDHEEQDSG